MGKVIVIDDSRLMRLFLRRCLEKGGFEVEEWVPLSAMEIPEHITSSAPELIITDYEMPGCNGLTVTRMLHKSNPQLPVIVLTSFYNEEMETKLLRLGVRRILTKPIEPGALIQAVQEVLQNPA